MATSQPIFVSTMYHMRLVDFVLIALRISMLPFPCRIAAARIIGNMDPAADPCEDFFQYACGGWLLSNEIPEEDSSFGTLDGISEGVDKAVKGK